MENGNIVDTDTDLEHDTVHDTEELVKNTKKKLLMLFLKIILVNFLLLFFSNSSVS